MMLSRDLNQFEGQGFSKRMVPVANLLRLPNPVAALSTAGKSIKRLAKALDKSPVCV